MTPPLRGREGPPSRRPHAHPLRGGPIGGRQQTATSEWCSTALRSPGSRRTRCLRRRSPPGGSISWTNVWLLCAVTRESSRLRRARWNVKMSSSFVRQVSTTGRSSTPIGSSRTTTTSTASPTGVGIELEDGWSGEAHPALLPDRSLVDRPSDRFAGRSQASNAISIVGSQTFEELLRRPVGSRP